MNAMRFEAFTAEAVFARQTLLWAPVLLIVSVLLARVQSKVRLPPSPPSGFGGQENRTLPAKRSLENL